MVTITPGPAGVEEMLDRRLGAEKGAAEIDRHHAVEVLDQHLVRLVHDLDAGIADQHIEAALRLGDAGEERVDRVLVGDVGGRQDVIALGVGERQLLDAGFRPVSGSPMKFTATLACSRAKRSAVARPMPVEAPVISTCLPAIPRIVSDQ